MALYGYTIGDVDVNPFIGGNQFEVYRFLIPLTPPPVINPELVGTVTVPNIPNSDLEGLGTNYTNGRVSAVNESDSFALPNPDPVYQASNLDVPGPYPRTATIVTRNLATVTNRFGTETGADFGRDYSVGGNRPVLYHLGANADPADGPVGTSLYKISGSTLNLIDNTPTLAERAGTLPTNGVVNGGGDVGGGGAKYADGLAIDNLIPGRTRALASDFSTEDENAADRTKNNLYKVDLLTGQLSAPIALFDAKGNPLAINNDSGLAFSQVPVAGFAGTPGNQRLLALIESGVLIEITDYADDLNVAGLGIADGRATAHILGVVNLPNGLSGSTDYEGFTIVSENAAGANV